MEFGTIGSVVGITVICYLAAAAVKATPVENKWLPVICGALGGVLGLVGYFCMADFPAGDYLTAIAVGIVSGLAATGSNQVYKQLGEKTGGATSDSFANGSLTENRIAHESFTADNIADNSIVDNDTAENRTNNMNNHINKEN